MKKKQNRPGLLRNPVTIQARAANPARNAAGEAVAIWTDVETIWAAINPAGGRELYAGEQAQAEVTHRIVIRHYSGLTTRHRLKSGTRIFDINVIRDLENRGEYDELLCKEAAS